MILIQNQTVSNFLNRQCKDHADGRAFFKIPVSSICWMKTSPLAILLGAIGFSGMLPLGLFQCLLLDQCISSCQI